MTLDEINAHDRGSQWGVFPSGCLHDRFEVYEDPANRSARIRCLDCDKTAVLTFEEAIRERCLNRQRFWEILDDAD